MSTMGSGSWFGRTFNLRALKIYLGALAVTATVSALGYYLPLNNMPNLALCPIIGLLFGPFGALGVDTISLIDNVIHHPDLLHICALDFVTTFMVSYIPYRLWYSTLIGDGCTRPVLNSVRNITKFIAVLTISGISYMILYNLTYGIIGETVEFAFDDVARLLNVVTMSLVYGFAAVIVMRYLGVRFYAPGENGAPSDLCRGVDPRLFSIALLAAIAVPSIVFTLDPSRELIYPVTAFTYIAFILFLLKPMTVPADDSEGPSGNGFSNSLIERIIVMFLIFALGIIALVITANYLGVLTHFLSEDRETSTLFYMGVSLVLFFIPATLFLWYVERKVTDPLTAISRAAGNFISSSDISENSERAKATYTAYEGQDSEIGDLAVSLTKMTDDMESYVNNIRELRGKQEKLEAELSVAASIQNSFIPTDFGSVEDKGVHIHASMTPAKFVGGDLYHFFMSDDDHVAFIVADVSGKGVPAALFMAVTKSLIEGHAMSGNAPEVIMGNVNNGLCNERDMFVTAWLGIMDVNTGMVEFVNAGHNPPVLRRMGAPSEYLRTRPGLVLGGMEDMIYKRFEVQLEPGDRIFLYTDGVTEANADYSEFYGEDRLLEELDRDRTRSVEGDVAHIRDDVLAFMNGSDQFDDITVLEIEYVGRH